MSTLDASERGPTAAAADEAIAPPDGESRPLLPFPIVAVGASAGGVAALREFIAAATPEDGVAYVLLLHLPPEHDSALAEVLARTAALPVAYVEDGAPIEPNRVYCARPAYTIVLEDGRFRHGDATDRPGRRRPVDDFFRSLAAHQRDRAIAVVLSGTGTNGTAGAQAIKAAGGLCFAQDPEGAEFSGMPQSLIHAGYADQVLPAARIPGAIRQYLQTLAPAGATTVQEATRLVERERQHLNEVVAILRTRTNHHFGGYKKPTVLRRIQRRMGLAGFTELGDYAAHLRERPEEAVALTNDLMINVTGFFRDADAWEALRDAVVRPLVEAQPPDRPLRAWVAACSSGEEAYTLAMLITEEAERLQRPVDAKIFATDTAEKSLALARAGVFPGGIEGDISPERLERFFDRDEHTFRVKKPLRDMVVFAPHDLLRDPPFSRIDLCTCRNLLIYLEPETQKRVLALLHFALRDGGFLFLGNAETTGASDVLFDIVSKKWRIYRRAGSDHQRFGDLGPLVAQAPPRMTAVSSGMPAAARAHAPQSVQWALLELFGPPSVVVDKHERVVYFHGDTAPYLTHPAGEPTRSLLDLVRTPLRPAVRAALRDAFASEDSISVESAVASGTALRPVRVTAAPLTSVRDADYYVVSFEAGVALPDGLESALAAHTVEVPVVPSGPQYVSNGQLEHEIQLLRRELQSTVEAFEASNEELKAANEEVTSINEELQSANEELETSKEELQALNEELVTVNGQLQAKIGELEGANNDLSNLLASTDIAVVFLDTNFCVRRFTPAVNDLLELIPADVGRPLAHLAPKFSDPELLADARRVLQKLVPSEAEVRSHSGRWYLRRTQPYRTQDNRIAGVVLTFVEISALKSADQFVASAQARLEAVLEQMPAAVLIVDSPSGRVTFANHRAAELLGHPYPPPFLNGDWSGAFATLQARDAEARPLARDDWPVARTLASGETVLDHEISVQRAGDAGRARWCVSSVPVRDEAGVIVAVATTLRVGSSTD